MKCDFGETKIKELEKANSELYKRLIEVQAVAEEIVVIAFSISELRDLWRDRFGLPKKYVDNGGMQ